MNTMNAMNAMDAMETNEPVKCENKVTNSTKIQLLLDNTSYKRQVIKFYLLTYNGGASFFKGSSGPTVGPKVLRRGLPPLIGGSTPEQLWVSSDFLLYCRRVLECF